MRTLQEKLGLLWLSPNLFVNGWSFFLMEEYAIILFWFLIIVAASWVAGMFSCICYWKLIVLITLSRKIMAGGICCSDKRLDGQVVVITGANTGIGKETAKDLALRGAEVVLACRDLKKAEKAFNSFVIGAKICAMELDLSSLASVRSFAKEFTSKYKKLNMLINNAGIMMCPQGVTEDGFETHYAVNHFGHFLLTNLLLPLLHEAPEARIITVSSLAHWGSNIQLDDMEYAKGYNRIVAYGNSKLANILFTRGLYKRLKATNIQVFSLHPGAVQSELGRHLRFGVGYIYENWFKLINKTTAEGAQTTLYCAMEAEAHPTCYFSDCNVGNSSNDARNSVLAEELWTLSEKFVNIKYQGSQSR